MIGPPFRGVGGWKGVHTGHHQRWTRNPPGATASCCCGSLRETTAGPREDRVFRNLSSSGVDGTADVSTAASPDGSPRTANTWAPLYAGSSTMPRWSRKAFRTVRCQLPLVEVDIAGLLRAVADGRRDHVVLARSSVSSPLRPLRDLDRANRPTWWRGVESMSLPTVLPLTCSRFTRIESDRSRCRRTRPFEHFRPDIAPPEHLGRLVPRNGDHLDDALTSVDVGQGSVVAEQDFTHGLTPS
jgi:hypothetical protein